MFRVMLSLQFLNNIKGGSHYFSLELRLLAFFLL